MLPVIAGAHTFQSAAKTALMRRSISVGLTCWASAAGVDRTRSLGPHLGPVAPGRPVHRARTGAGIRSGRKPAREGRKSAMKHRASGYAREADQSWLQGGNDFNTH